MQFSLLIVTRNLLKCTLATSLQIFKTNRVRFLRKIILNVVRLAASTVGGNRQKLAMTPLPSTKTKTKHRHFWVLSLSMGPSGHTLLNRYSMVLQRQNQTQYGSHLSKKNQRHYSVVKMLLLHITPFYSCFSSLPSFIFLTFFSSLFFFLLLSLSYFIFLFLFFSDRLNLDQLINYFYAKSMANVWTLVTKKFLNLYLRKVRSILAPKSKSH